jgi:hypothetical protein
MIGMNAIGIEENIEAECELAKWSIWIHPKRHNRVLILIYLFVKNNGDIPIDKITIYFPFLTNILKIKDKTEVYTSKYREFIGAGLKLRNHPVDCFQYTTTENCKRIMMKFAESIPPREAGDTLVSIELENHLRKTSPFRRAVTQENAWNFEFCTWYDVGVLERGHKPLRSKEEDVWIMIPKTLYRTIEAIKSIPGARQSQVMTEDIINRGNYDREWAHPDTYALNWDFGSAGPGWPRRQIYSVRHITQRSPLISIVGFLWLTVNVLSLGMDLGSATSLGRYIYFLILLLFLPILIPGIVYSYSFLRFTASFSGILSARSILLGIQFLIGGLIFGLISVMAFSYWSYLGSFLLTVSLMILTALSLSCLWVNFRFTLTNLVDFLSVGVLDALLSVLAAFLTLLICDPDISVSSSTVITRMNLLPKLVLICFIGGAIIELMTLSLLKKTGA